MNKRTKAGIAISSVLAAGAGAAGIAAAGGSDDTEAPIKGSALEQASDAALAEVGEGHVTQSETGDEESYYEIEVTKDDGSQVDVQLNRDFDVVGSSADSENEGDDAGDSESGAEDG